MLVWTPREPVVPREVSGSSNPLSSGRCWPSGYYYSYSASESKVSRTFHAMCSASATHWALSPTIDRAVLSGRVQGYVPAAGTGRRRAGSALAAASVRNNRWAAGLARKLTLGFL